MRNVAVLAALLASTAALAGCGSPDGSAGGAGFTITPPATAGGEHLFEAGVAAENYTWDLGDRLTVLHGRSVRHAYDVKDATLTVILKARNGQESKDYAQKLVLGSGQNQKPTFLLEAQTDWAVTGETVAFTASGSHDPEDDPLRFSWSCLRTGDAVRQPPHSHPVIGIPFASAPAGSVTSGKANRTLPAPDATHAGDLCEALGTGTRPSTRAATIAGAFSHTGIYEVYLLAADPAHPTTSGSFRIYVTPPSERPAPVQHHNYTGILQGPGAGGAAQGACDPAGAGTCDRATASFSLPLPGLGGTVDFDFSAGPSQVPTAVNQVNWDLRLARDGSLVASGSAPGVSRLDAAKLLPERYDLTVVLAQGANADWRAAIAIRLDMDPAKVY